ncbi:remorin-like protein [Tanacetum coccineum]
MTLIKAWEENEKPMADNKAYTKISAIEPWENTKSATIEADLKQIETSETEKQKRGEKMKNKMEAIHKEAEEKTGTFVMLFQGTFVNPFKKHSYSSCNDDEPEEENDSIYPKLMSSRRCGLKTPHRHRAIPVCQKKAQVFKRELAKNCLACGRGIRVSNLQVSNLQQVLDSRNLSTTTLMERIPSRWPRLEWHAPWFCERPQQLSNEKFSAVPSESMQMCHYRQPYTYLAHPWGPFGRVVFAYSYMDSWELPRKMCNMGKKTHEGRSRTVLLHAFIDPNPEGPWLAALRIPLST